MNERREVLPAESRRGIERFLDAQLVEWDAPGGSVAVFDAEGVLYRDAIGARSIDPVEPATPDSLLHVASVTKSFTAIALLQFVENGDLTLDDAVTEYVPFFADAPGDPITVAELLAHASGIPSDVGRPGGHVAGLDDIVRRWDRWADERLTDRERLMYYNGGYVVLGALVRELADRPFAEHLREAVLDPLGMTRSTFDHDAIAEDPNAMTGYVGGESGEPEPSSVDPAEFPAIRADLYGAGGLLSTVTDLAALGPLLLDGGTVDGDRPVADATVERMTRPQSPAAPTVDAYDVHHGHGWLVEDLLADTLVYSGGGLPGYGAFVGVLRERGLGVSLGVNRGDLPKVDVGMGVLALACGEDPYEAVRFFRARRAVDAVSGTYEAARTDATATVEPAGDGDGGALDTKIAVTLDDEGHSFRAAPDAIEGPGLVLSSVMGHGFRWTVEFPPSEDGGVMVVTKGHRGIRYDAV